MEFGRKIRVVPESMKSWTLELLLGIGRGDQRFGFPFWGWEPEERNVSGVRVYTSTRRKISLNFGVLGAR